MNKLKSIKNLSEEELIQLGLKSGIEIHQQLEGRKLFCNCPTILREDEPDFIISRKLRAIAGESGEVDQAAAHEHKKDKTFQYEGYNDTNCLVELDETPPLNPSEDAIKSALVLSQIFKMSKPSEIRFMRKTVVDGSNTSGFQRTAIIGIDGEIFVNNKKIRIETICLEEDSCKNIETKDDVKKYNLSRLGIPLIEIATAPDLKNPIEVKNTAEYIGMVLRSLPNVKRGLGTIRQDVNVSIKEGVRVEIKGAQDLKLIPKIVEQEAIRQKNMLNIFEELKIRKAKVSNDIVDLSSLLKNSKSKVIISGLSKKEGCVLGIKLINFKDLLGFEVQEGRRFGSELSDHAKVMGVKGLFHSDELPNYGMTEEEKNEIYKKLNCNKEKDAFIIIADSKIISERAMGNVIKRLSNFSLQKCVRTPRADGTSSYMRPMPGASRMYPETDILPVEIKNITFEIPILLSQKIEDLMKEFNLAEDVCKKLIKNNIDLFLLVKKYPNIKPAYMVDFFFSLPSLIKKKFDKDVDVSSFYHEIFLNLNKNIITKESIIEILIKLNEGEVVDYFKYKPLSIKDIEDDVKKILSENKNLPRGALMGKIMSLYSGKVSGKEINDLLSKLLN